MTILAILPFNSTAFTAQTGISTIYSKLQTADIKYYYVSLPHKKGVVQHCGLRHSLHTQCTLCTRLIMIQQHFCQFWYVLYRQRWQQCSAAQALVLIQQQAGLVWQQHVRKLHVASETFMGLELLHLSRHLSLRSTCHECTCNSAAQQCLNICE
jgi:hypothetical protein